MGFLKINFLPAYIPNSSKSPVIRPVNCAMVDINHIGYGIPPVEEDQYKPLFY